MACVAPRWAVCVHRLAGMAWSGGVDEDGASGQRYAGTAGSDRSDPRAVRELRLAACPVGIRPEGRSPIRDQSQRRRVHSMAAEARDHRPHLIA